MDKDQTQTEKAIRTGPLFGVMFIGAFIAFLNQTLINIALPQLMEHFHIEAATADWLITIYMLVNGIVIPITAFLLERFTTRQLYIACMSFFTIGTFICAIAPGFYTILIGRVVQAVGAGILMPLITNVIFTLFPPHKRGAAMGTLGIAINFAPAIGPTLSGWIVQTYSWRLLFYIVFPIALANLVFSFFFIKNVSETSRPQLDVWSVIFSTIGFGGVLYSFATAGIKGWSDSLVITMLLIGGISLILFIWRQFAVKNPILEFRIFRYPMFSLTTVINVIVTMALFSGMILIPIYMQHVRGFSPLVSGLMLLPGGILMGLMSPITGRLFDKIGAKWLSVTGLVITVITTYALTDLDTETSFGYVTGIYTARMFGMALLMMPIFTAGLNALPLSLNRHGTAMVNTMRMMAGAVGMAFFVTVMTNQTAAHMKEIAAEQHVASTNQMIMMKSQATADVRDFTVGPHIASSTEREMALVAQATVMGIDDAFMIATFLTVVSLLLAFFIKNANPEKDEPSTSKT
ncbi:DHA2 family efflux MFS transporter permease subunit [Brevibacillus sp. SYSU BS000544]|uniref:DHA2 family efflux MFS transporter permease subunit n=1 Tax=Brevibacillus sp. SYSU BS000544 TaxID=3416443 RepID=UPI003CE44DCC